MRAPKPSMPGFWIMAVIIGFKLLVVIAIFIMVETSPKEISLPFNWFSFGETMVLLFEAMAYWYRRYHIERYKLWVNVHGWTTFIAIVVLPVIMVLLMPTLVSDYYKNIPEETVYFEAHKSNVATAMEVYDYVYWTMLIFGHIFFIATIVKSFGQTAIRPDESQSNESPGLLDDLSD